LNLLSAVALDVSKPQSVLLNAAQGTITKDPRQVVLTGVRLTRDRQKLQAGRVAFFLRPDNTVDRILAENGVESEFHGRVLPNSKSSNSGAHMRSDRAELLLTGTRNQLTTAILSGDVQLASQGTQAAEATAGQVTLHFAAQQMLDTVHAENGVRLVQKKTSSGTGALVASSATSGGGGQDQDIEMTAPAMDFVVREGRLLERAETRGPPQIAITQLGANQKTVVTAGKFTAKFTEKNRLASLHGEPNAKIVSGKIAIASATNPPDRVSTSQMLDVVFRPEGGVASIVQSGGLAYVDGPQKAWAERGCSR